MSTRPARLAGLDGRKGRIAPGLDADLVIWDPEEVQVVQPAGLYSRHKISPYLGARLHGVVKMTVVRGQVVYDGAGHPAGAAGKTLLGRDRADTAPPGRAS
jgi:allantoinase